MSMAFDYNYLLRLPDSVANFDNLPAEALVNLKTVMMLSSRSKSSVYRDIQACRLAKPIRIGPKSSRWRVCDVKEYLTGQSE